MEKSREGRGVEWMREERNKWRVQQRRPATAAAHYATAAVAKALCVQHSHAFHLASTHNDSQPFEILLILP